MLLSTVKAQQISVNDTLPFSTNRTHLTIWNGESYVPIFIKGVNFSIAVPGTFPGQLSASRAQYGRWLQMIREAGFNTIRLYTLHYPHFYEVLDSFNIANPQHPIYFFQGVWLEEEVPGYTEDLYSLTPYFDQEIQENIDCVHGKGSIPFRLGKAYGSYQRDASRWLMGYIIGREVHPPEVLHTNQLHAENNSYKGRYLSIQNANPTEAWIVQRLDKLLTWENDNYKTQRPVSFSSWPSLDPLEHPKESNWYEDTASIDLSGIETSSAPAGYFASYHAYPYYPDFMSRDPAYTAHHDYLGQNSYVGYLTKLKEHYRDMPLIIAEFGTSSSWGTAHYAQNGIHHGGFDEKEQGKHNLRLLQNMQTTGCGGGMQFSWMDEWFKRTWITDPMDYIADRRILWHNVSAAEQNFGLIGFRKPDPGMTPLQSFCENCPVRSLEAGADYAYFNLRLHTNGPLDVLDTVWIALDTYRSDLGESRLMNGVTVSNRAEFLLMVTNAKAELYVTEAYDLYGIWHGVAGPKQLFHSVATNGAPWRLVRWRNNNNNQEVQYIGDMRVNRLGLPRTSRDAVVLDTFSIDIRLPWTLINYIDPSTATVMHDDRATPIRESMASDGIAVTVYHQNKLYETTNRFNWPSWNHTLDVQEYTKASYDIAKEYLRSLPGGPVARYDSFTVKTGKINVIAAEEGVLKNDLALDGGALEAVLVDNPDHGHLILHRDGGFEYIPEEGKAGAVSFTYRVASGINKSEPVHAELLIEGAPLGEGFVTLYPNPTPGIITIASKAVIDHVEVLNSLGEHVAVYPLNAKEAQINLERMRSGMYFIRLYSASENLIRKIMIVR